MGLFYLDEKNRTLMVGSDAGDSEEFGEASMLAEMHFEHATRSPALRQVDYPSIDGRFLFSAGMTYEVAQKPKPAVQ